MLDDLGGIGVAVGVADLARGQRLVDGDQLVASGQDRHPRLTPHRDILASQCGQHPDLLWTEPGPAPQYQRAFAHVLAGRPDVVARLDCGEDVYVLILRVHLGVLDLDDGIGARRERRAGHDANRRAGRHLLPWLVAGRQLADDAQTCGRVRTCARGIGGPQRVAVHRRVGVWWNVDVGVDVLGQHAARRLQDRHLLRLQRFECIQHTRLGFLYAQHRFQR